jgi:hypothetical protein
MRTILSQLKAGVMTAAAVLLLGSLTQPAQAADTRLVIRHSGGTDSYPLSTFDSVEFTLDGTVTGIGDPGVAPTVPTHLFQNFPNPFNPQTQIAFDLPSAGRAEIRIYDVRGRLVRTLVDKKRPAGHQIFRWDGRDDDGRAVASGTYCVPPSRRLQYFSKTGEDSRGL